MMSYGAVVWLQTLHSPSFQLLVGALQLHPKAPHSGCGMGDWQQQSVAAPPRGPAHHAHHATHPSALCLRAHHTRTYVLYVTFRNPNMENMGDWQRECFPRIQCSRTLHAWLRIPGLWLGAGSRGLHVGWAYPSMRGCALTLSTNCETGGSNMEAS
eukprot:XP_001702302.1 predicted protein [Chlamydomonas reinhardtii]